MSTNSRRILRASPLVGVAMLALCGATNPAGAQDSVRVDRDGQRAGERTAQGVKELGPVREALPVVRAAPVAEAPVAGTLSVAEAAPFAEPSVTTGWAIARAPQAPRGVPMPLGWFAPQQQNVPQDVRIMQTIVSTALSEVRPPEMPQDLAQDSAAQGAEGTARELKLRQALFSRGDVSGFYMQGYGYLFTVNWPVGSTVSRFYRQVAVIDAATADQQAALAEAAEQLEQLRQTQDRTQADTQREQAKAQADAQRQQAKAEADLQRAQEKARQAMEQQRQARSERLQRERVRSKADAAWAAEYRRRLTDALRDAIAGYGSTLRRAGPGEAITFIGDFGGGDSANVTMTVKASALQGSNVEANRRVIQVSRGSSGVSDRLRTQLEIMSQIIDTSLRSDASGSFIVSGGSWSTYYGGQAEPQYVPGYGVIFRKSARMNTARAFVVVAPRPLREGGVDSAQVAARKSYQAHLDTLRRQTVDLLVTYGPTLTELSGDDWVGIYYDVGPAATLLDGGLEDYLVQARMRDIRQASAQSDPAAWLAQRLVTNEKGD